MNTKDFYIYQIPSSSPELTLRPNTHISEGLVRKLDRPRNDLFFWKSRSEHDLILFLGFEPNLNWPEFCQVILDLARQFRSPRIYCIGSFFDQVPHTRETRVHVTVSHQRMKSEFEPLAYFGEYAGPCSFTTMLIALGHEQGIEVVGVSARTPIYIHGLNSRACYDLLKNVLSVTGLRIDLSDLRQAGEELMEMTDRAFIDNAKALAQLRKMEGLYDSAHGKEPSPDVGKGYDKLIEEMRKMKREGRKPH